MMTTDWCIKSLRAADGGAQVLVMLENGTGERETLALFAARLERMPRIGALDEEQRSYLRREAAIAAAICAGLRALSACGASRRHLTDKLRARGIAADVASEAVEELAARGYLNEEEGALREAERGLSKLWGDRRIWMELRAKGYGDGALESVRMRLENEDAVARCVRLMRRSRIMCPANEAELRKLLARLMRYGYAAGEVKRALVRMAKE